MNIDPSIPALRERIRELERERDEAREVADPAVCGYLNSGGEHPREGWIRNGEEDEETFVYAAKRGLIERHPKQPLYFKFTATGKEFL